ncbi:MAG TPA: diguanylate cyclase [Rhizobacter sp.]|nr:diguanylate cyclase [Rhizobacter sp.]
MNSTALARDGRLRHRVQALAPFFVTFGLLALLWTVVLVSSGIQQARITNDAQQQLRLVNNAVVQHTRGLLQNVDGKLQVIDHWVQAHPQADPRQDRGLAALLALQNNSLEGLITMSLATGDGKAFTIPPSQSWLSEMPPVTWADQTGRLHIGAPVRSSPSEPWRWPVSRRLARPAGEVAGAVAWIDLASLSALHESLRDKPAGAITLTRTDAVAIVRTPHIDSLVGRDLRKTGPVFIEPASAPEGQFVYDGSLTDGTPRVVCYERLGDYPVTVLSSQGVNETLATFHARRRVLVGGLIAVTLFALVASVLLVRSRSATRRSQAELATLSNAFPLGIFRTDLQGETTYANEAYFQKLGLTRDRMAWGWSEIAQDNAEGDLMKAWRKAVAEGLPLKNTLRVRRADNGEEAVLSVHTAPLWVDGQLAGQVGSLEDVTERIQEQRAQRMLTAIFEQSTDVVAQLAPDGRLLYLNPAGRARLMLGRNDSLDALRFEHFTPPQRAAQVRDVIIPAALENGVWVGETAVLGGDGREIAMSEMLIVHRDDDNKIEAFSAVMRDISFDLQARAELQRSDAILNVVAATLPALVAVVDKEQRYLFTNDAFARWAQRAKERLTGHHISDVIGEHEYAQRRLHIEAALAGHRTMFESERVLRSGSQFYETTYIPFHSADGEVAGFVALSQDITAHRLEQQKLLDASQTDVLTGVLNRAGFDQRIHEALDRAEREPHLLALLCLDLDGFKPVNDEHGHAAGDALLTAVARRLQRILRPPDILARLGGDEFAVVLPDVKNLAAATVVARKIVSALGEPFQIDDKMVHIGASVGVALAVNGQDTAAVLMQRADTALYRAKRAGRGRHEIAA